MSLYDYTKVDPYVNMFIPQTNGEVSNSITQNWTEQAYECYSVDCDCARCSLGEHKYSFVCQMPKIIKTLIKTHGEPKHGDFLSY